MKVWNQLRKVSAICQILSYAMLAKSPAFAELAIHPLALAFAEADLGPDCLLSACLAIRLLPDGFLLTDLASTNGTFVADLRIQETNRREITVAEFGRLAGRKRAALRHAGIATEFLPRMGGEGRRTRRRGGGIGFSGGDAGVRRGEGAGQRHMAKHRQQPHAGEERPEPRRGPGPDEQCRDQRHRRLQGQPSSLRRLLRARCRTRP